jgi:hypothetical protein
MGRSAIADGTNTCWYLDRGTWRDKTLDQLWPGSRIILRRLCTRHDRLYLFSTDAEVGEAEPSSGRFEKIDHYRDDDWKCSLYDPAKVEDAGYLVTLLLGIFIIWMLLVISFLLGMHSDRSLVAGRSYFCCTHHPESPMIK